MGEVTMLVSGIVLKDNRKIVRVSFLRDKDYAEGVMPDAIIEKSEGFTPGELTKLEKFLRLHKEEILQQAKEVNPIRSWLKES